MEVISFLSGNNKSKLCDIPIMQVVTNPNQPRKVFSGQSINELSESISQYGLIQPVTVRKRIDNKYELISGERRLRACKMLGLKSISAICITASDCDSAAMALIENLQREDLNYFEEAESYSNLITDFGLTQDELARKIGKTQSSIANKLRILRLSLPIKKLLRENDLSERHARALLKLPTEEEREKAAKYICAKKLNVKETDKYIETLLKGEEKKQKPQPIRIIKDIRIFSNTISQAISLMKKSGVNAISEKHENDEYIEYIVKIPKVIKNN